MTDTVPSINKCAEHNKITENFMCRPVCPVDSIYPQGLGASEKKKKKLYNTTRGQIVQPIKKPVRTLSIFTSMAFVKDANGISFKNRLKGHINWRKVRNFITI